jgi:hypothetical protein
LHIVAPFDLLWPKREVEIESPQVATIASQIFPYIPAECPTYEIFCMFGYNRLLVKIPNMWSRMWKLDTVRPVLPQHLGSLWAPTLQSPHGLEEFQNASLGCTKGSYS